MRLGVCRAVAVLVLTVVLAAGAAVVVNGRVCPCHEIAPIYFRGPSEFVGFVAGCRVWGFAGDPLPQQQFEPQGMLHTLHKYPTIQLSSQVAEAIKVVVELAIANYKERPALKRVSQ